MIEIIKQMKDIQGFRMAANNSIFCSADDAFLIAENVDNLGSRLLQFAL